MSSTDKSKLDGIQANATAVSFSQTKTSGTEVGKITINGTTTTLYSDTNTDTNTKVTQTVSTTNNTYPLLATATANQTATSTNTAIFGSGVKLNPSNSSITATTFIGALNGTATKATGDGSGNNIVNTYAPKASPALTGTPTAPTASAGTATTQIATTEFVNTAINNLIGYIRRNC